MHEEIILSYTEENSKQLIMSQFHSVLWVFQFRFNVPSWVLLRYTIITGKIIKTMICDFFLPKYGFWIKLLKINTFSKFLQNFLGRIFQNSRIFYPMGVSSGTSTLSIMINISWKRKEWNEKEILLHNQDVISIW